MARIFDSHAHYDDSAFDADRKELLNSLRNSSVCAIVSCGCDIESSNANKILSDEFDFLYFSAGFHPENLEGASLADLEKIEKLALCKKCVAIGEIGLDYHWMAAPKDVQKEFFERQILLAKKLNLPVIVHDREAHADVYEILKKHKPLGVLHCFSGSAQDAAALAKQGMYIGFNGIATFKNARKSLEAAKAVPLDKILLETDCPYCAPVPHRGERNDSSMIIHIARRLSQELEITENKLLEAAENNARKLFSLY